MATLRIFLVLAGLSLFLPSATNAQKSPLTITGAVSEVKVSGILEKNPLYEKNPYGGEPPYKRTAIWFDIHFNFQYCNKGEIVLIVPMRSLLPTKVLFLELPSRDSDKVSEALIGTGLPSDVLSKYDPMPGFLKELEKPEPSTYRFAIIEPGRCYETFDRITVRSGYKLEVRPSGDKRKLDLEFAVPEHAYFKIQYSLSMKDPLPVADAKQRWSKIGKLLTSADGDFFFETDVIINKLRD